MSIHDLLKQYGFLKDVMRRSNKVLTSQGSLTLQQFYFLNEVFTKGKDFEASAISEVLGVSQASVSIITSQLWKQGYLLVEVDVLDRRRHVVKLTSKGQKVYEEAISLVLELLTELRHAILDQLQDSEEVLDHA